MEHATIDSLYVFTTMQGGKERVLVVYDEQKRLVQPMMVLGQDIETLEIFRENMERMAHEHKIVIELTRYTQKEVIEIFSGKDQTTH